jgi:hypothetical protein
MEKRIRLTRTNRSGKVIPQEVYATRLKTGWEIKSSEGWTIEASKLYHPMAEYFMKPTLWNLLRTKISISYWRRKFEKKLGKDNLVTDGYGAYLDNTRRYFQFRERDYEKMLEFLNGKGEEKIKIPVHK